MKALASYSLPVPNTDFREYLDEVKSPANSYPEIITSIDSDLENHAKRKKALRRADQKFIDNQTPNHPGLAFADSEIIPIVSVKPSTLLESITSSQAGFPVGLMKCTNSISKSPSPQAKPNQVGIGRNTTAACSNEPAKPQLRYSCNFKTSPA